MYLHIISAGVAKNLGISRYFTGMPCLHGHYEQRLTANNRCLECSRVYGRKRVATPEFKARRSAYDRALWETQQAKIREKNRRYYQENSDAVNAQKRGYYAENVEQLKISSRAWRERNPHVARHHGAKRKAQKIRATPKWANQEKIKAVYADAERISVETGVLHHVDHIVPLIHPLVCGLHVDYNLRPLPAIDNIKKGNKLDQDLALS